MKKIYPEYYNKFKCIAGSCPDTCCAGWEIVVDKEHCEIYKSSSAPSAVKASEAMYTDSDNDVCLRLKNGRCPLLRDDNLCMIYIDMGEEFLCDVCRIYPRFNKEVSEICFSGISLSCPEAARLILSDNTFGDLNETPKITDDEENAVFNSYKLLRSIALKGDFFSCKGVAEEIQGEISFGDIKRANEIISEYILTEAKTIPDINEVCEAVLKISSFDILTKDWKECLELLNAHTEKAKNDALYRKKRDNAFALSAKCDEIKNTEVYYLYKYLPEAMESCDIESMAQIAYMCSLVLCELYSMEMLNGTEVDFPLKLRLSQLFSKELEHNEDNLNKI